mgnify:CR=1 FL=1
MARYGFYVWVSDGEDFERINVACPRKILEEGLEAWRHAYEAKDF